MKSDELNLVYSASLEFGANWRKPIPDIVKELLPELVKSEQLKLSQYIEETRKTIENHIYDSYNREDDSKNDNLSSEATAWVKSNYPWMNDDNVGHAVSQGIYYAWRG